MPTKTTRKRVKKDPETSNIETKTRKAKKAEPKQEKKPKLRRVKINKEPQVSEVKKSRGRPKKVTEEIKEVENVTEVKKSRGRPKKVAEEIKEIEETKEMEEVEVSEVKKSRGRPKKKISDFHVEEIEIADVEPKHTQSKASKNTQNNDEKFKLKIIKGSLAQLESLFNDWVESCTKTPKIISMKTERLEMNYNLFVLYI